MRLGQVAGARHASACVTILRLHALLCQVAYATFVRALVHCNFLKEVRLGGWGQTRKCVRCYTQVACATILCCQRYYIRLRALSYQVACATLMRALVYCNFLIEVRLGGWGQTRKCVRYYTQVVCATVFGGVFTILRCVRFYIRLRAPHQ